MNEPNSVLLVDPRSVASLRSLYTPTFGRAYASKGKVLEGLFYKKGDVVKNWKHRLFIMDKEARVVYYFRDRRPESVCAGFIPLYDAALCEEEESVHRVRGAKAFLRLTSPLRRTFFLGFADEGLRLSFQSAASKVRAQGRAQDAAAIMAWWRQFVSHEKSTCSWATFSAALTSSLQVNLSEEVEASLAYLLLTFGRADLVLEKDEEGFCLSNVLEFGYLFGTLPEALTLFDGALPFLCCCETQYAEALLKDAAVGTFVLYLASAPTIDSAAILGLAYVVSKGKIATRHCFRDPVLKRFFCDLEGASFETLDHLVSAMVGVSSMFARQTKVKFQEMERLRAIVRKAKQRAEQEEFDRISSVAVVGPKCARDAPPRSPRSFVSGKRSAPGSPRQAPGSPRQAPGSPRHRPSSPRQAPSSPRQAVENQGFLEEIEQLLLDSSTSSDGEEQEALEKTPFQPGSVDVSDHTLSEANVSEMVLRNRFCVLCGEALENDTGADSYCASCERFRSPGKSPTTGASGSLPKDVKMTIRRRTSLTETDCLEIETRSSQRKEAMLGLNSLGPWMEKQQVKK